MLFRIGYVSGAITTTKATTKCISMHSMRPKTNPKMTQGSGKRRKKNHLPSIHLRRSVINFYRIEIVQFWFDEDKNEQEWRMKGGKQARNDENRKKDVESICWQLLNNSKQKFVSILIDFQVLRFIFRLFLFGMKSPEVIFELKQSYRRDRRKKIKRKDEKNVETAISCRWYNSH